MGVSCGIASRAATAQARSALRVAGFTADRLWVHLLFFSVVPFVQTTDVVLSLFSNMLISMFALGLSLLACLFFYSKIRHLVVSKYFVAASAIICACGTAILGASELTSLSGIVLALISGLMTGVGSAMLYLGWIRIFGRLPVDSALRELTGSLVISFGLSVLFALAGMVVTFAVLVIAPLISGFLLRACAFLPSDGKSSDDDSAATLEDIADGGLSAGEPFGFSGIDGRLSLRRAAGMAAFGFAAGFANVLCSQGMYGSEAFSSWLLVAGLAIAVAVYAFVCLIGPRAIQMAHRLALLLMACGCMLIALMPDVTTVSNVLVYAGLSCFGVMILGLALVLRFSKGVDPIRTICVCAGCLYFGEVVGLSCGHVIEFYASASFSLNQIGFVLTVLVIIGYLFLLTETDLSTAVSVRSGSVGQAGAASVSVSRGSVPDGASASDSANAQCDGGVSSMSFEDKCAAMSAEFGLSPRESEVLPLLLRGRTIARMAEELFISPSTVNTHVRHIYDKCGAANKQALLDMFDKRYND